MKHKKQYPMNGPSLQIQRLIESPTANRELLREWAKSVEKTMRPETLAHIK